MFIQIPDRPETRVPSLTVDTLYRFLLGLPPGGFVTAVLDGKSLVDVSVKADRDNKSCLSGIAWLIINYLPPLATHGVNNYMKETDNSQRSAYAKRFREVIKATYGHDVDPEA